jgi:hypothetical protein
MNPKTKFGKLFLAVLVLGLGLMLCPHNTAAFTLTSADVDQITHSDTNFNINSIFMEMHRKKAYVVVGEKTIYLIDFKAGDKHYKTVFVNEQGDTSYAASVTAADWVGKRALVKGYKLNSGKIVAESIERVELRHK